eukprot:XP_014003032.1 PREDICTED: plexin-B3-like [Salmo salar]
MGLTWYAGPAPVTRQTAAKTNNSLFLFSPPLFPSVEEVNGTHLVCRTSPSNQTAELTVRVLFGKAERSVPGQVFHYMEDPVITAASPAESFYEGGRSIKVSGRNLDVVQQPMISVRLEHMVENTLVMRRRRNARLLANNNPLVFNSTVSKVKPTLEHVCHIRCYWSHG